MILIRRLMLVFDHDGATGAHYNVDDIGRGTADRFLTRNVFQDNFRHKQDVMT
ncbi:hypothetical protein HAPAU_37270 [Halalkalicoccus paucihalophilus]|uniref:Uncharacterized protein n=1 Tax=Halalkalicoccus paucihalophilus TaxID=1008153 RepID=A0A151A977_9EURY|nr:hypothetical protein HAPAU_37270 [Halalkalicoccus paucihalophilus]